MHPARFSRRAVRTRGRRISLDRRRPARAPGRRTSRGCASTSVRSRSEGGRRGRSGFLSPPGGRPDRYTPSSHGRSRTEESRRTPLLARVPFLRSAVERGGLRAVHPNRRRSRVGRLRTVRPGRRRSYGFIRPVLKHGPRSLACARVFG